MRTLFQAVAAILLFSVTSQAADTVRVYIGTYTRGTVSEGIYLSELNLADGSLSEPTLAGKADNPSFLAIAPDGGSLFAVEETGDFAGEKSGSIRSFAIDAKTGALRSTALVSSGGAAPCHIVTDSTGRSVFFANYSGGSTGSYRTDAGGKLIDRTSFHQHEGSSLLKPRQAAPHAHSINLDPAGRFAYVADLGLDKILIYKVDPSSGAMTPNDPPFVKVEPGAGPRHFTFRPDGKFAYVINEIDRTVTVFSANASNGSLEEFQAISTVPESHKSGSTAHIECHPSGKFLYGSNRGHDSIAVFRIDPETGKLGLVEIQPCGGKTPRNFGIDPSGRYLLSAGQNSSGISVFKIDMNDGSLSPVGKGIAVPRPVCVRFARPPETEFARLFDGETLKGWEGEQKWFRVVDGAIVAGSLDEKIPKNQFLVTEREFGDFELRFKAKLIGQGKNAGVQFWSQRIPDHHEMIGFQCDIGSMRDTSIWGALYDESRRRKFLAQVPIPTQKVTRFDDWNDFRIRAEGNVISIWINGAQAARYFETEPGDKIPRNGRFGLQIHSGPPAEAWYKDIEVREL